ncbi:MAG: DUF222 domain-containing protein, partial [Streptosporangiaceae bacterium]
MSEHLFSDDDTTLPCTGADRTPPGRASAPGPGSQNGLMRHQVRGTEAGATQPPVGEQQSEFLSRAPSPPRDDYDVTDLDWPDREDDPGQWPLADEEPDPEQLAWGLPDEYPGGDAAEYAAWLASLPPDVRADYLAGPYTGAGEAIPPGFTHRDLGGPSGAGFAAGGALDRLDPGPWLAQGLAAATSAGWDELTDSEQVGVLCGWQRQVAWSQACLAAAVSSLAARRKAQSARPGWSRLGEHIVDELAVLLTLTSRSAGRMLGQSVGLDRLPEVAAALRVGAIDWARATLLAELLAVLPDDQARAVAVRLLARASEQTTAQLRAATERAVLAADPDAAQRRRKEGRKDIRVEVWHEPSGNAALAGRELRPADAIAADAALTADAGWLRDNGAAGTLTELRAAAYLARLSGRDLSALLHDLSALLPAAPEAEAHGAAAASAAAGAPGDSAPGDSAPGNNAPGNNARGDNAAASNAPGSSANSAPANDAWRLGGTIHVTMPLAALAGLTEAPGEVAGYGPADAATCRDLAAQIGSASRWCLTLTGPDGTALAHACAGRRGPAADQPVIRWAAGLRTRLQKLERGTCSHAHASAGYVPPTGLRHLVRARQRQCSFPGCRRASVRCDLDHTVPFEAGGMTCECNLAP